MNAEARRQFVHSNRTAILGYTSKEHGPAMSIVYYTTEPDGTILVSTMGERAKAKACARIGKASLCVLDEQWPPTYLQVYCDVTVDEDFEHSVDTMMRIGGVMAGGELDPSVRPLVEEGARVEGRVVLRLRPYATFETPPKHVSSEADINEDLLHSTSTSQPW
jgi:hypothetical protein